MGTPRSTLEQAQAAKYELACRTLGLVPGDVAARRGLRLGGMVPHAAEHHGLRAVGVTLSRRHAERVEKADRGPRGQGLSQRMLRAAVECAR